MTDVERDPITDPDLISELDPISDTGAITLETEIVEEEAAAEIADAVSARHSIARKYVLRLRRRNPDATPAEVIQMLERSYATSITTAGAMIAAGGMAATVGISLIPGGGAVAATGKAAGQQAAKAATGVAAKATAKAAAKAAAKSMALGASKSGALRVAALLPAGEQQLQFELTAIFGLAIADIHGMDLDRDQAHALVYGLTNERVSQQQIAKMAADLVSQPPGVIDGVEEADDSGDADRSDWASTLANRLPAGAARSLVQTVQTGHLDTVRESLTGKQQTTVEYGVSAVVGGVTRFVFGRDVIKSAKIAFPDAPDTFPSHLSVPAKTDDLEDESNRALAALEDAATATGAWFAGAAGAVGGGVVMGAGAVGSGVSSAAGTVSRPFRSVDIDGDGIPDEAQALNAVKGVGGAIAGAAGAAGGSVAGLFKRKKRDTVTSEVEQIERVQQLLASGAITADEAQKMKSRILGGD